MKKCDVADMMDDPVHIYPYTAILMKPGDVIYSHKTALSSFMVGHAGIVGVNYRIYHVNRWGSKGHADSMPIYLSRHKKGEKLTILRNDYEEIAEEAAKWAKQNIEKVKKYTFTRDLADFELNYCSKYIWQAYYFGSEGKVDLTERGFDPTSKKYVTPTQIYNNFDKIGSFVNK
ncbi:hypothetical protein CIL05_16395 [Virgibacillus profundi]|uniref:LRAT domain-containing protein n=1 Tax=Virgibacillus profundi TaxID=2024555 RepID=A0A2A2IB53_9BACI|nr:hypothetical protein [Virgibacillus profundi]PAV28514.1 hypothetical protein CIL05_16395 [Virgibacillus profundi]PXY52687.1 hypothetical protein CIT14_16540 [Virgibacillus profundi]